MPKRIFNWKLAIVLMLGLVVFGVTAFGLRQWRKSNRAELGLILGNQAYDDNQWEEAAEKLGRYLVVERDDVSVLLKYADAHLKIRPLKRNNIQQAIAAYRTVLRVDKNNCEGTMRLAELYLDMEIPGEAELITKRYLEAGQDPEIRRILALVLVAQRKFDEAAAELRNIIEELPQQISAYETLGQLTEQYPDKFSDPPEHWFNEAIKHNPSSALAHVSRAGFHIRGKDRTKALVDLEQAEQLDLSEPEVRLRLAEGFIDTNVLDKAEKHLEVVQDAEPTNHTLWQMWARFALKSQSPEKMLQIAETGLKMSSQLWDFMPLATELFIKCGHLDRATNCISEMRQKDIDPPMISFLEGFVANYKQHDHEAAKCWRRSIELGNESPQIRLMLASTLSRLGDHQSAVHQLRALVSERPNFLDGHLALARLLAQMGNWAGVMEHARIATQLSPDSLDPVLLQLNARIQMLEAHPIDENVQIWREVEQQLSVLEEATNGALEVKLLQLKLTIQQGKLTNAEQLVAQLKKDYPSEMRFVLAEAELLVAQGKNDKAILTLNKTIEEFPDVIEPVEYLAALLARQGNYEKAETVIKDALAHIEKPVAHRGLGLLLAQIYTQRGEEEKAYEFLVTLAQKLPSDIPIKRQLLDYELNSEDLEKAQQIVDNIKALEGESGWQWRYEQARVWLIKEDFKDRYPQIITLLQGNLLANPEDQASRTLLAAAHESTGKLQLAISTYREALSRSPDDLRIIIPMVATLYKAEEYDHAEEILNRAAQQKLYHPELQKLQFQSYLRRGQLSLASDILEDLFKHDPNLSDVGLSLALLKIQQNKFAEADVLLAKLRIQEPHSLPVTTAQIELNIRRDKPEEALRLCDEVVNSLGNASAYILRSRTYAEIGQIDRALEDLAYAIQTEPNNIGAWVARSDLYNSMGQLDKATTDIQQALSLDPCDIQIQERTVLLLFASGRPDNIRQARNILDKALESHPDDSGLQILKVRSMLAEGTAPAIENAEQILQKITEDKSKVSEAWMLLGEILLRQGQPGKAIDIALRGLTHRSNDKALLLLKARAEAVRSPIFAIPTLRILHELDPNDADTTLLLANIYITADKAEEAINLLKTQLLTSAGTPDEQKINIALAIALHKNGDKSEAQKEFDLLYQSTPNDPRPLLAQARLFKEDQLWSRLNQKVTEWYRKYPKDNHTLITIAKELAVTEDNQAKETAEDILRMILENDSDCTEAMMVLAMLLKITNRSAESAELCKKVLELEPDNVIAINNLAWIICEEQTKFKQALELARRGLNIAPQYIDLIDTRGMAYYRLGELEKAIQDFSTCIKLYPIGTPSRTTSYFHLGRAFVELGQREKAVEYLKQALDLESKTGGLETTDLAEVHRLLEELEEGS